MYNAEKCVNCLRCTGVCDCHSVKEGRHIYDSSRCTACGKCVLPLCDALEIAGREVTTEEVIAEVEKDALYYANSGGGLTLSGGEPLSSPDVCLELLKAAKENGIHTCVETCGFASRAALEKILPYVDLFLFDCKETNPSLHKEYTGVDNSLILENLRHIDSCDKEIVLRCPIIPGINDRDDHFSGIAELANSLKNVKEVVIEPYHTLGVDKYNRLSRKYALCGIDALDAAAAENYVAKIQSLTKTKVKKA